MLPYILLFLTILIFAFRDITGIDTDDRMRKILFFSLTMIIALFVGMRDMIGGYDVYIYGEIFDVTPPVSSFDRFLLILTGRDLSLPQILEPGFLAFGGIVKLFTDSRYHFFLILSLLSYFLIFRTFRQYMPFLFLAIFIFSCKFMLMSFVYVRQMLAMAIVWSAIPFVLRRDVVRFMLLILIAFFIHNSSLLFLPVYFLGMRHYSTKFLKIGVGLCFLLGLTPFFSVVLGGVGETMNIEKAQLYANKGVGGINYFYIAESTVIAVLLFLNRERFYADKEGTLFFNLAVAYVCLTFFTLRDATGMRFVWYFLIGMVYVIALLPYLYRFTVSWRQLMVTGIILYFSALHFRLLTIWDYGDMIPYQTFLSDTQRPSMWKEREYTLKYAKPEQILE